jgi:hypothetical protein
MWCEGDDLQTVLLCQGGEFNREDALMSRSDKTPAGDRQGLIDPTNYTHHSTP